MQPKRAAIFLLPTTDVVWKSYRNKCILRVTIGLWYLPVIHLVGKQIQFISINLLELQSKSSLWKEISLLSKYYERVRIFFFTTKPQVYKENVKTSESPLSIFLHNPYLKAVPLTYLFWWKKKKKVMIFCRNSI